MTSDHHEAQRKSESVLGAVLVLVTEKDRREDKKVINEGEGIVSN